MRMPVWVVMCGVMASVMVMPWYGHAGYTRETRSTSIKVASDLEVLSARFGSFEYDSKGRKVVFVARDRVEMTPGKTYGWQLEVKTSRDQIAWREILTLPSAPLHWGVSEHVELSLDRTIAITSMTSGVEPGGTLSNYWIFSEGDPTGPYTMRIEIDGVQVAQGHVIVD